MEQLETGVVSFLQLVVGSQAQRCILRCSSGRGQITQPRRHHQEQQYEISSTGCIPDHSFIHDEIIVGWDCRLLEFCGGIAAV